MPSTNVHAPSPHQLFTPKADLADFTDRLSQAWGVGAGASAAQYVKWSESTGLLSALSRETAVTVADLYAATNLSEDGMDSLLPVLMALGLVAGDSEGRYSLTGVAEEYFLSTSPYYVGAGLFWGCEAPMPVRYSRTSGEGAASARPLVLPDAAQLLRIQLSRNLAAGVSAVRSGRFEGIRRLIDIGGGGGALAIPFALDNPDAMITLVDLADKVEDIRELIRSYNLERQITLQPMDVFADPWDFEDCDAILFGNFFHMFPDAPCQLLAQRCFESLESGRRVLLHEVLFDEGKAGPLIAALWNANMHVIGGRQRTERELSAMLHDAGFADVRVTPTAARFSLLEARKA